MLIIAEKPPLSIAIRNDSNVTTSNVIRDKMFAIILPTNYCEYTTNDIVLRGRNQG